MYIADNKAFKDIIELKNTTGSFSQAGLKQNTSYYVKTCAYVNTKEGMLLYDVTVKTVKTAAVPKIEVSSKTTNHNTLFFNFNK